MMDRLLREGNPPTGQLASPKPQYKDVQTNSWEELKGEGGASYVKDKDALAKLEQVRELLDAISAKDFATQTTLAAVLAKLADLESELATIEANQLSGDQKVQLSGTSGNIISPATEDKLEQVRQLLAGVATEAKLEQASGLLASISGKDFATQTTLAQVQSELALVKAELQEIKANQLSGEQKVQLSGSNIIKTETVITRGVRTTSQNSNVITPPVEARGFVAKLRVYGITGTFETGEGVRMYISHRLDRAGITRVLRNVYTKYLSTNRVHTCLWFPGLESNIVLDSIFEQEAAGEGGVILMVGLPVHDAYRFSIGILGSFATEQGVDCDLVVEWYR